jgi:hypothetical protein
MTCNKLNNMTNNVTKIPGDVLLKKQFSILYERERQQILQNEKSKILTCNLLGKRAISCVILKIILIYRENNFRKLKKIRGCVLSANR